MPGPDKKKRGGLSRRDFLKGVGVGGGVALTTVLPGGPALADEKKKPAARPKQTTYGPGPVKITLNINGKNRAVTVEPRTTLLETLRGKMDLTGAKEVCDRGECGACTVLMDGHPVNACMTLAIQARGAKIQTVESLSTDRKMHAIQEAFVEHDALQCGYCTPGFVMATKALLDGNKNPSGDQVREGLSGNLCRCGSYARIFEAVDAAAKTMRGAN